MLLELRPNTNCARLVLTKNESMERIVLVAIEASARFVLCGAERAVDARTHAGAHELPARRGQRGRGRPRHAARR